LSVIASDTEGKSIFDKLKSGVAKALIGQQDALTIIGPASVVKEMRKDPKKLEVMMK